MAISPRLIIAFPASSIGSGWGITVQTKSSRPHMSPKTTSATTP